MTDPYVTVDSPAGPLFVAVGPAGVARVDLADEDPAGFEAAYLRATGRPAAPTDELPNRLAAQLARAIDTGRLGALAVDLGGLTPFQEAVLRRTAEIPPGEVRPYGWVAAGIGRPGASRAVGSALAANPVPILVPCHRVVRSGRAGRWSLGHYSMGAGPALKRQVLAHEGVDVEDA